MNRHFSDKSLPLRNPDADDFPFEGKIVAKFRILRGKHRREKLDFPDGIGDGLRAQQVQGNLEKTGTGRNRKARKMGFVDF